MSDRAEHVISGLSKPTAHYSDAVSFGGVCHIAGLLALDEEGRLVGGEDVSSQSEQVLRNLALALRHVGSGFPDLLKITVFLTSIGDRAAFDAVRRRVFGPTKPASTLVEVSALAVPGAKVEVEAIVALPDAKR